MIAKAGDKISAKAQKVLAALGIEQAEVDPKPTTAESAHPTHGNYFCIDCGIKPQNNMQAQSHCIGKYCDRPKHRMAWFNWDTHRVEVP